MNESKIIATIAITLIIISAILSTILATNRYMSGTQFGVFDNMSRIEILHEVYFGSPHALHTYKMYPGGDQIHCVDTYDRDLNARLTTPLFPSSPARQHYYRILQADPHQHLHVCSKDCTVLWAGHSSEFDSAREYLITKV